MPAPPSSDPEASAHDLGALAQYHERTRVHGANRWVSWLARLFLQPLLLTYLTLTRTRPERFPEGPVLVVANHRSFLDPFLIACLLPWRRPLHFMGKAELFARPRVGWVISRGGGFPVRRGESDPDAMETARRVLARGGMLVIFPEGTRLRHGGLGEPKRGAGRLAVETGATVLPITVLGVDRVRRAKIVIRPVHCQVHAHAPFVVEHGSPTRESAAAVIDRAWQAIQCGWREHGGAPEPGVRTRPSAHASLRRHLREMLSRPVHAPISLARRQLRPRSLRPHALSNPFRFLASSVAIARARQRLMWMRLMWFLHRPIHLRIRLPWRRAADQETGDDDSSDDE